MNPCAVSHDLELHLDALDDADRREAAIEELFNELLPEYTAEARLEAERIIDESCRHCFGRGCRKCEEPPSWAYGYDE